jgi:hypothetical protein
MMSKKFILLTGIVMVLGTIATSIASAEITLLADDSCRTKMEYLDGNDHSNRLVVRVGDNDVTRTFKSWVKFDVSGIDVQGLVSATFAVSMRRDRGTCEMDISYVNDDVVENIDWTSDDITWNNAPGNDPSSETDLDPDETTFIERVVLEDALMHDQFIVDALEALHADTDGIVQFVLHNSSSYLNIVAHDEAEEQHLPFVPVLTLVMGSSPYNGKTDVSRDAVLTWLEGEYADKYNVYFGTDVNDVNEATIDNPLDVLAGTGLEENTYDPPGLLEPNQTYHWRIDEVNDTDSNSPLKGDIWSFITGDHVTIDDFEAYNDINEDEEGSNRIYLTWSDGYANPNVNGGTIGYPDPDFANGESFVETDIVYSGSQSGPFLYNNTIASSSEVTLPMIATALGSDWTQGDFNVLTLWFYGETTNPATESLYVKLNSSKIAYNGDAADLSAGEWIQWDINLSDFAGLNLSSVTGVTVGTERAGATGSEGMFFLDDIRARTVVEQ